MAEKEKLRITPAKGRPFLHWVNKRPLEFVEGYPPALVEVYDPQQTSLAHAAPRYDDLAANWQNLLFHGDNKEAMGALLEMGFRGKVGLIYIDPPFMSNADYVRKLTLRGTAEKLTDDEASLGQEVLYEDIWNNDNYLQFMYERLQLLKELLKETGTIYVHMSWHVGSYVKILLDEVFGKNNFVNEIIWAYGSPSGGRAAGTKLVKNHDIIFNYAKDYGSRKEYKLYLPYEEKYIEQWFKFTDEKGKKYRRRMRGRDEAGNVVWEKQYLDESPGVPCSTVWDDINSVYADPRAYKDNVFTEATFGFTTQKPEKLLERIHIHSSLPGDLVLDAYCGAGTTCAVAQKLGRRWIGIDINKGAIQLTHRRIQIIIEGQVEKERTGNGDVFESDDGPVSPVYSFATYQVNDYDFSMLSAEARRLALAKYGVERIKTDPFFDGVLAGRWVKVVAFDHPLSPLDLEQVKEEIDKRPEDDRDIYIFCYGREIATREWVEDYNRLHPANKIEIKDLMEAGFTVHEPTAAEVEIIRNGDKATVAIKEFISPSIIRRLDLEEGVLRAKITDFRAMIDAVKIDVNYDGKVFRAVVVDVPKKKQDLVAGKYEIELPNAKSTIAIKIIDMLGEEILYINEKR